MTIGRSRRCSSSPSAVISVNASVLMPYNVDQIVHNKSSHVRWTRRGQVAGLQFSAFHVRIHAIHAVIDADSSRSPEKPETRAHVPRVLPLSSPRAPRCVLVMALLIVFGVSSDTAIAQDLLHLEPNNSLQGVRVVGVRDGDTLVVEGATWKEIRVIGVDTPEMRPSAEEQRLWQRVWCVAETDVTPMALEARGFVSRWLGNPTNRAPVEVEIEVPQLPPDGSIDVLGRLLAYADRRGESGNFRQSLSGELLREGYSKAFLTDYRAAQGFPNITALYKATLVDQKKDGRESRRGFWNRYGAQYATGWTGLADSVRRQVPIHVARSAQADLSDDVIGADTSCGVPEAGVSRRITRHKPTPQKQSPRFSLALFTVTSSVPGASAPPSSSGRRRSAAPGLIRRAA